MAAEARFKKALLDELLPELTVAISSPSRHRISNSISASLGNPDRRPARWE